MQADFQKENISFKEILSLTKKKYKEYSFLELSSDSLYKISDDIYFKDLDSKLEIENYLIQIFKELILEMLKVDKLKILNGIINTILNDNLDIKKNILQLQKFILYLKNHDIKLDNQLITYLIKTNILLANNLKVIVLEFFNNNLKLDDDILNFLRIYCEVNDIDYIGLSQEKHCQYTSSKVNKHVYNYLLEIKKYKVLTKEEEIKLFNEMKNGDKKAREKLIQHNLKLVYSIAKNYIYAGSGLDLMDLIQEGNKGLIKAIDKFDIKFNSRLSTYATTWIYQSIRKGIVDMSRNIRIPNNIIYLVRRYKKIEENWFKEHGEIPNFEDIATLMKLPLNKALELYIILNDTVSFNNILSEENDDLEHSDFVLATEDSSEEMYLKKYAESEFLDILKTCNLSEKELEIIILRYGFLGNHPHTLEEIGKKFKVTRERINQIEKRGLKKIISSDKLNEMLFYGSTPRKIRK